MGSEQFLFKNVFKLVKLSTIKVTGGNLNVVKKII